MRHPVLVGALDKGLLRLRRRELPLLHGKDTLLAVAAALALEKEAPTPLRQEPHMRSIKARFNSNAAAVLLPIGTMNARERKHRSSTHTEMLLG